MALSILCGSVYSSSMRIYMLLLMILILVSYCSSSSASLFEPSNVDISNSADDISSSSNSNDVSDENDKYQRLSFRPASSRIGYPTVNRDRILSAERLFNLLFKSARIQEEEEEEDRLRRQYLAHFNKRRYIPQSFHAMRG